MKYIKVIKRDFATIFKNPYNRRNISWAICRYFFYVVLKVLKVKKIKLKVWNGRQVIYYNDSIQSCWLLFNYQIDFEEFNFLSRYLSNEDTFFDVGSNLGYYSVWASKFINQGKIYAFEPNSKNYERLNEVCKLNKGNFQTYQMAVSAKTSSVKFTMKKDVLNHIIHPTDMRFENSDYEEVKSIDLNSFCFSQSVDYIDYLKIDVEGFELDVLSGASKLLEDKKINLIQLELEEDNALKNSDYTVNDVLNLLNKNGYKLCKYDWEINQLIVTNYTSNRDNYFATSDINAVNNKLNEN